MQTDRSADIPSAADFAPEASAEFVAVAAPEHSLAAQGAEAESLSVHAHAHDKADVLQDLEADNGISRHAIRVAVPTEDISSRSTPAGNVAMVQAPEPLTDSTDPIRADFAPTEAPSVRPNAVARPDASHGNRPEDNGNNEQEPAG